MRLTEAQISASHATDEEFFGGEARVSLSGSRVDDHQPGRYIDLLIEVDHILDNSPAMAVCISVRLECRHVEQCIHVLIIDPTPNDNPSTALPEKIRSEIMPQATRERLPFLLETLAKERHQFLLTTQQYKKVTFMSHVSFQAVDDQNLWKPATGCNQA